MVELRPSRNPRYRTFNIYGVTEQQAIALKECLESKPEIYTAAIDVRHQLLVAKLAPRTYTWEVEDAAAASGFIVKRLRSPFDEAEGRLEVALLFLTVLAAVASYSGAFLNVISGLPAEALGLFIVIICGYPALKRALTKVLRQKFDADLSMAIAIMAPFIYSLIAGRPFYYVSGLIVFVSLASGILNRYIRPRFEAAGSFLPTSGIDNEEHVVEIKAVRAGDVLTVKPGFRIPADGTVLNGSAMVTAADSCARYEVREGMPAEGGSVVDGSLKIKVARNGGVSRLTGAAGSLRNARKPVEVPRNFPVSIERILLPVSLLGAAFVFLTMDRPGAAAGILLVAAPCAMILARPISLLLSKLGAARTGIIFESHGSIERISMADTVVFDGLSAVVESSKLTDVAAAPGHSDDEVKVFISSYGSADPVFADEKHILSLADATRVGPIPEELLKRARAFESKGLLARFVFKEQEILGAIAFELSVPKELARSIERLNNMNRMSVLLLSAEPPGAPEAVAKKLGIAAVKSRMRDDERFSYIEKLAASGKNVLAAGKGCGLSRFVANSGVITIERPMQGFPGIEDVICGSASDVHRVVLLSKKAVRRTNEGMWIGLYFNVFALMAASSGLIDVEIAVLMVVASIVAVTVNSARMYLADAR